LPQISRSDGTLWQCVQQGICFRTVGVLQCLILKDTCQLGKGKRLVKCTYWELALRFFSA